MLISRLFNLIFILCILTGLAGCSAGQPLTQSPFESPTPAFPEVVTTSPTAQPGHDTGNNPTVTAQAAPPLTVVYEKAGSLWFSRAGVQVRLTSSGMDSRPRFSPDGRQVVFLRITELWVVNVADSAAKKVFGEGGVLPLQFEFSPQGGEVYFTTANEDGKPRFDLRVADVETGSTRELLPAGSAGKFTASPGWDILALVKPGKISTYRIKDAGIKEVYKYTLQKGVQESYIPPVAWLEDGYGFKTVIPGSGGKPSRFMFIPASGEKPALLAEFNPVPVNVSDVYISPDGSKVLYLKGAGDNLEMHTIDAGTADRAFLSKPRDKIMILGWTPDSENMLLWLEVPGLAWATDGRNISMLASGAPVWSIRWLSATLFLFENDGGLYLRSRGQPEILIDTSVGPDFDARIDQ